MSYRRPSFRRALALTLAIAVGPAAVLAPSAAQAVAAPGPDLELAPPATVTSLAFDDGRVLTHGGAGVRVDAVTVPLVGQVTLDGTIATHTGAAPSSPDRHTFATSAGVDVLSFASTGRVLVRRGAATLLNVAAPAGSTWSVDVSGPYVRIGRAVYDIRRGTSPIYTQPLTTTNSALYGSRLVWSESDGTVRLRDVATFTTPTIVRAGTPSCTTCSVQVAINATTVAYGKTGGWLGLWDLRARTGTAKALLLTGVERIRLGDGFLVTTKSIGIDLFRLNDPLSLSAPDDYLPGVHVLDLATDGHAFAYVRADGSAAVAQLPDSVDGLRRPAVLAATGAGAFSPNGDKIADTWAPSFVLTRPVTSWQLAIIDGVTSAPVATFASAVGAPATANVSVVWEPAKNKPQGNYPWTLTATGPDGALMQSSGAAVTGLVSLRRTNTRTSVTRAPADVATAGRSARTPLSWRAGGAFPSGLTAASYDVQYRAVRISKGKRVYGPVKPVLTRTMKTSTTFKGTRGATYQFRARNKDTVGLLGPWSSWATSNTPLDDRSKGVKYSKGWKSKAAADRWAGTHHWTKKSKRTASVDRRVTSGFALVMRTCATCGSVKVYVDGKLRKTVKLSSSSTMRSEVYSINFKKLGRHSIKVVTVVKGKKKLVALDAIVVRH